MHLWKTLRNRLVHKQFAFVTLISALMFGASGPVHPAAPSSAANDDVEAARKALQSRVSRVRTMLQDQGSEAMRSGTSQDLVQWYNWNNGDRFSPQDWTDWWDVA